MKQLTNVLKALSDANRLRILKMLEIRPLCVCEIKEILQLANSTVSKHLSILREADLVRDEKDGKWVNYALNDDIPDEAKTQILLLVRNQINNEYIIKDDLIKVKTVDRKTICGII